jgi:hypothetical protein
VDGQLFQRDRLQDRARLLLVRSLDGDRVDVSGSSVVLEHWTRPFDHVQLSSSRLQLGGGLAAVQHGFCNDLRADADADSDPDPNSHADADADADSDADPNSHGDGDADSDPDPNADADADSDPDPNSDADAWKRARRPERPLCSGGLLEPDRPVVA